ncbi:GIY-YIG nuclease family protein [Actinoplanes utahensis]
MCNHYADDWRGVDWTPWVSLNPDDGALSQFPTDEGIYRIRHRGRAGLTYIGETGRSVRGRVRSLARGAYADEMPYRDPHTAAPCLWAIRQEDGPAFEVSISAPPLAEDKQSRKAFEDALIALYRRDAGESPTANFGRIIPGYKQSTYSRDSIRGGPLSDGETESNAELGVGPLPWTDRGDLDGPSWMGLDWTTPCPLQDAGSDLPTTAGLYRIWKSGSAPPLEYIGQTANLRSRLYRHRRNRDGELEFSYTRLQEHDAQHKREEVETELIGAHWLETGESPTDQF